MEKTIIAVYGRSGEGKSTTIKNVLKILEERFSVDVEYLIQEDDVLVVVKIAGFLIGLESQGDPNSRMLYDDTLQQLIDKGCDLVICATRTEGKTVGKVDELAVKNGYRTLWKSSYYAPHIRHDAINLIAAEEIVNLILYLIAERI